MEPVDYARKGNYPLENTVSGGSPAQPVEGGWLLAPLPNLMPTIRVRAPDPVGQPYNELDFMTPSMDGIRELD